MSYIADKWAQGSTFALDLEALNTYEDIIDLSIGDPDFTTDSAVIDAAMQDAHRGYTHYGVPQGDPELIAEIVDFWAQDYGLKISAQQVLVTPSSALGMAQTLMALLNPGEEVVVFSPYFPIYTQQIYLAGGVTTEVALSACAGYEVDAQALEAAITPRTKAVIVNNPVNPTGVTWSRESLEVVAQIAQAHDLVVIADETYTDLVFDPTRPLIPFSSLEGMASRTVTLNSFSKNYMMTGWRIGFAVAPPQIIAAMSRISDSLEYAATSVSQRAALHALRMRRQLRQKYVAEFGRRLNYVADRLAAMQHFELVRPSGTFYLFPRFTAAPLSGGEVRELLLHRAHVLVSPGEAFGSHTAGHVRLACTVEQPKLVEACDRLERLRI